MSGFSSVGYFLVSAIFGFATFILWLRFGLQYFRISSLHPISQTVSQITEPLLLPIARMLQVRQTRNQRYDWLCFGVLVGVVWVKYLLISLLFFGHVSLWSFTAIYTVADLIIQPCNILFYALLIRIIMSWVNPHWQHPIATVIYLVTEPLLQPLRQKLPSLNGLDFSPLFALIILKIITLFVGASLPFHLL